VAAGAEASSGTMSGAGGVESGAPEAWTSVAPPLASCCWGSGLLDGLAPGGVGEAEELTGREAMTDKRI
jgi:hypothetical protein